MDVRYSCSSKEFERMNTSEIRNEFLVQNLFEVDKVTFIYSHIDRMIVGGVIPVNTVKLEAGSELKSKYFLERREMGIINIGGDGIITVDNKKYIIPCGNAMYIGRGSEDILFESIDVKNPAKFYINSTPAHKTYKTVAIVLEGEPSEDVVVVKDCNKVELGELESSNHRVVNKFILPGQVESCQLVMGYTTLKPGSVWNSMPCHTHERRMEVYMYFNLPKDEFVMHFMGKPSATRNVVVRNEEAIISPSWSVHFAAATKAYTFVWGMAGENQEFDDMDGINKQDLR